MHACIHICVNTCTLTTFQAVEGFMLEIMHLVSAQFVEEGLVESTVYLMHPKPDNPNERVLSSLVISAGFSRCCAVPYVRVTRRHVVE